MIGSKIGKLTIESQTIHFTLDGVAQYVCRCDCGQYVILNFIELATNPNQSCGCIPTQRHNMSGTKLYKLWTVTKSRHKTKFCIDWLNPTKFIEWALANGYSENCCNLTRKNRKLGFNPDNCYWTNKRTNLTKYCRGRDIYIDEEDIYKGEL